MPYIVTGSGARVSLEEGYPTEYDIAVSHCRTPMFAGHTTLPYSVAHHCVSAAGIAWLYCKDPWVAYFTLLHEAETAVYGDVPGPVKCEGQRVCEKLLRNRVFSGFLPELPDGLWEHVELYDKVEQAAAVGLVGLSETVHDKVWEGAGTDLRELARYVVRQIYETYPPKEQLVRQSPLANFFLRELHNYRELLQQQGEPWQAQRTP